MSSRPRRVRPALDVSFAVVVLVADALCTLMTMVLAALRNMGAADPRHPRPAPVDWVPVWWFAGLAAVVAVTGWALRSHGWRAAGGTQLCAAGLLAALVAFLVLRQGTHLGDAPGTVLGNASLRPHRSAVGVVVADAFDGLAAEAFQRVDGGGAAGEAEEQGGGEEHAPHGPAHT
ncbi:DUF6234 family protein [Streptomyces filamentosus]|uniref:Uncharacterized protein n=1 Tax=Streptomyces filamentosus TaxID=67294 RepID=A0A919BG17_STRFL|nr:DUF6234 family protein [Streptomyces filamentosus]GHF88831.1 hypothetical protein GCM10017667_16990 [Streptomyces filamentosus]